MIVVWSRVRSRRCVRRPLTESDDVIAVWQLDVWRVRAFWQRMLVWSALLGALLLSVSCSGGGEEGIDIPALRLVPNAVTMAPLEERRVEILGGVPPYRAQSNAGAQQLVAGVDGNRLVLRAGSVVGTGSATVSVIDSRGSAAQASIQIQPQPFAVLAPSPVELPLGTTEAYAIRGGVPPYTAVAVNPSVAAVQVVGDQLRIQALARGSTQVSVYDANNATVQVDVRTGVAAIPLAVAPQGVELPLGQRAFASITGGTPPYTVVSALPDALTARIATVLDDVPADVRERTVVVQGLRLVDTPVSVSVQDATGERVETSAKIVGAVSQALAISPNRVKLSESTAQTVTFVVSAPDAVTLTAYVSNAQLLTPSAVSQGRFTVSVNGATACVAEDVDVTVSVVDSAGRVGEAVVTITDAGNQLDSDGNLISSCPDPTP